MNRNRTRMRGFTLVELIVAIGLFAVIMTLASGAYLLMIGVNRQVQGTATGINNLAFALEDMTRTIRTGTGYSCGGGDCNGGTSFMVRDSSGVNATYARVSDGIRKTRAGNSETMTDSSVTVSSLRFYATGTDDPPDYRQAYVTIVISGTVATGKGSTVPFTVETSASMRGSDI